MLDLFLPAYRIRRAPKKDTTIGICLVRQIKPAHKTREIGPGEAQLRAIYRNVGPQLRRTPAPDDASFRVRRRAKAFSHTIRLRRRLAMLD